MVFVDGYWGVVVEEDVLGLVGYGMWFLWFDLVCFCGGGFGV